MADLDALDSLEASLVWRVVKQPNGSATADGYIASTLGVAALPYTSNDTDAQALLPAGWSWTGTYPSGHYYATRASDGKQTWNFIDEQGAFGFPSPLSRCVAAVGAHLLDEILARSATS